MRQTRISTYIDLLFCLVILPVIIMLAPVEKWIIHHTYFMLTLIVYLYALYFTYRKANIPSLFLRHKFGQVFFLIAALLIITWGLSQIPIPKDKFSTSSLDLGYTTAHANTNRMVFLSHRHRIQSRHRTDIRTISPNSVQTRNRSRKE